MERICKRDLLILRRKQVPMNQMEIAAQLGISQAQYSNIENGYVRGRERKTMEGHRPTLTCPASSLLSTEQRI